MSNPVETLRQVQIDIRLVQNLLGELASELKTHPARTSNNSTEAEKSEWIEVRKMFERRKAQLKQRLLDLTQEQDALQAQLTQTPVTRASLGHIIASLVEIEARFTARTALDAWDALTAFIDWLEREDARVNIEEQVAKLEAAA